MNEATTLRIFSKTCEQINNIKNTHYKLVMHKFRDISKKQKVIAITEHDTKTNLEHSLAHILYDSKVPSIQVLQDIAHTGSIDASKILKDIIHTLEAERVEYNWGMIYRGSKQQFERQRNERTTDAELDPISAIQYVRNGEIDQVKGTPFEAAIDTVNGVHGYDNRMSIKLAIDYYNKYIKDFINNNIEKELEKDAKKFAERDDDVYNSSYRYHLRQQQEYENDHEIKDCAFQQKFIKYKREEQFEFEYYAKNGTEKSLEKIQNMDIEKLKNSGEKKTQKINQQLMSFEKPPPMESHTSKIFKSHRAEQDYTIDYKTANKLEKIFRTVRSKRIRKYDEYGEIIDIDEYVQSMITKENRYWDLEKKETGLNIIIGIDLSGSMTFDAIDTCRNMCGTILQATRRLPNVNVVFVPWSTSNSEYDLTAEELYTFKDIRRITKNHHLQNANDLAHQYLDDIANKYSGKKVIIMMTDGYPNCYGINNDDLVRNTKNAVRVSKRTGNVVYGVYLGIHEKTLSIMKDTYKDDFVHCTSADQVSTAIIELVKNSVIQVL